MPILQIRTPKDNTTYPSCVPLFVCKTSSDFWSASKYGSVFFPRDLRGSVPLHYGRAATTYFILAFFSDSDTLVLFMSRIACTHVSV